uniref:site-specific DNA-methyltransferase (adenine-specific) n=1 Tax=Chelativorans sp. (strain BNC1) TaxID=266779 RepID=Q11FT3_CHESB
MSTRAADNWQADFGIDPHRNPNFLSSKDDLTGVRAQAHVLRHAFDLLGLDGILCSGNTPLIYFKQVDEINTEVAIQLHRQFWNHGGAPVLVLVSKDKVHVYSGMARPVDTVGLGGQPPSLVETLDRVAVALREFIVSVESGSFFQRHARSFDPEQRVDRDLLSSLGETRRRLDQESKKTEPSVLDALLCRLVFTCYLCDREVILPKYFQALGIENAMHLRDVLAIRPLQEAKAALYCLFRQLGNDFNGDLFSDDLDAECRKITNKHIEILDDFFSGTDMRHGQRAFWPYDFGYIPIETISAIYEHFLKDEDQRDGAFYTPRFLAEVVLDSALEDVGPLLGKKFLDPACGSGIFLVGLFIRMAEEWKQANPKARYGRRARELMQVLRDSLFGVDKNPIACRIAAFSLYLAYLDQLTPSDIQQLQKKGRALPLLTWDHAAPSTDEASSRNIHRVDFFQKGAPLPQDADLVLGNPPWGSIAGDGTPAGIWCAESKKPLPDKQIAVAFIWKAAEHASQTGKVCFLLPHGVLVNHGPVAVEFQRAWVRQHTLRRVLNLADLRHFLFRDAIHPAIVVEYAQGEPDLRAGRIQYWAPKADWMIARAEIINVSPIDRKIITVAGLFDDLNKPDAPQIWVRDYWGSPRDLRLIDRLSLHPRLRDHVRLSHETGSQKRWVRAEGFQPAGRNDDPNSAKQLQLPSRRFIGAKSAQIDLFLLESDCQQFESNEITVRGKSNTNTDIYKAPHVLITKGFKRIAFADFDVSFRHALRGIHGPKEDRNLLIFLAAYLRSPLAQYFAFHTSANRSMFHEEVQVNELLRLPFPLPRQLSNTDRSQAIVDQIAKIVDSASEQASQHFLARASIVETATEKIEPLIAEYFELQPSEMDLVKDTVEVTIPSIQPSVSGMPVPTVKPTRTDQQQTYVDRVCNTLNSWAGHSRYFVRGTAAASLTLGIGIAKFEKLLKSDAQQPPENIDQHLLETFDRLRTALPTSQRTIDPIRELMVFDNNQLYLVKPVEQRHWTQTAALNDADEVAGTILMHSLKETA